MDLNIVFLQVVILFVIVIIGIIAGKTGIITRETNRKLTGILLYISMPLLILMSFQRDFSEDMLIDGSKVLLISIGVHVFSAILATIIFRRVKEKSAKIIKIAIVFANCAFMGFPVVESIFGSEGIFYASFYVAIFNVFLWIYAVAVLTGKSDLKSVLSAMIKPGFLSVIIGILLFVLRIKLPEFLAKPFEMVGSITTPLSMIIVGVLIANSNIIKLIKNKYVYLASLFRLLIIPGITLLVLYLLGFRGIVLNISVLLSAMPAGVNIAIFAEKFEGDAKLASGVVGISTVISIITLNAFVLILSLIN